MAVSKRYNPRAKKFFSYTWSEQNVIVPTPARLIHRYAFQRASKDAAAILADTNQREVWQQRFDTQTECKFFRPYIVSVLLAEYKSQLREELECNGTLKGQPIASLITDNS